MRKSYLSIVASLAIIMTSCGGAGSSLSKSKLLDHLVAKTETQSMVLTFPEKVKPIDDFEKSCCEMELLKQYESLGLITMKDTTVSYRHWGTLKTYDGIDVKLTEKGLEPVVETGSYGAKVLLYKYDINKIVDMELISRVEIEMLECEIITYAAFYTGKIIEVTPFITVKGVKVGDTYPLKEGDDAQLIATVVTAVFRNGELVEISNSGSDIIKKSEIKEYSTSAWLDQLGDVGSAMRK